QDCTPGPWRSRKLATTPPPRRMTGYPPTHSKRVSVPARLPRSRSGRGCIKPSEPWIAKAPSVRSSQSDAALTSVTANARRWKLRGMMVGIARELTAEAASLLAEFLHLDQVHEHRGPMIRRAIWSDREVAV